jgi:hypothetical protein
MMALGLDIGPRVTLTDKDVPVASIRKSSVRQTNWNANFGWCSSQSGSMATLNKRRRCGGDGAAARECVDFR